MIITNELNLPQAFVQMAQRDEYETANNEYRVTSLLKGIRETELERRHSHEIKRDVSDMVWLLFGTATHSILERQKEGDREIKETRLKMEMDGIVLSGQFDLYSEEEERITDYKTASVWKIIYGNYEDWRRQLLIYAYMLRDAGFPVKRGRVVAFLKDHSKRDAKVKAGYPKLPVQPVDFTFSERDFQEIEVWLKEKIAEVKRARELPDDRLPLCTQEERFNSGDKYAVMKKGRKTALRVLDSQEEAEQWMASNGGDSIEIRPGEDKKCQDYCAAKEFCSYYKEKCK